MRENSRKKIKNKNELPSEKPKAKPNVRRIGHNYERKIVIELRNLGFERALTTRMASKIMDDAKIDIYGVDYNIQCKSVRTGLNVFEVLASMEKAIPKMVPERENFINLVFHKKEAEEVVVLRKEDFYLIIKTFLENGIKLKRKNIPD
jgi:Holliday junction resolvase